MTKPLLTVTDLHVNFISRWPNEPSIDVLRGVGFNLYHGERVAIVGESGRKWCWQVFTGHQYYSII